jgi:hypothetical protein
MHFDESQVLYKVRKKDSNDIDQYEVEHFEFTLRFSRLKVIDPIEDVNENDHEGKEHNHDNV